MKRGDRVYSTETEIGVVRIKFNSEKDPNLLLSCFGEILVAYEVHLSFWHKYMWFCDEIIDMKHQKQQVIVGVRTGL